MENQLPQVGLGGTGPGVSLSLTYSTVGQGAGAPLHKHEVDELIVLLEGRQVIAVSLGPKGWSNSRHSQEASV